MDNRPRYRVPDELRETLLDFTIAYLLERPPNLVEFGIQFFQRLKGEREQGGSGGGRGSQVNGRSNEIGSDDGELYFDTSSLNADSGPSNIPPLAEKLAFRASISINDAGDIARIGAGEVYKLEEVDATWIFHLAARCVLEAPDDIVEWGLQYCLNEKDRWAYA